MTTPINDGGPAFPVPDVVCANGQIQFGSNGMSLRDWFAGQETLAEWDNPEISIPDAIAIPLAGPKPEGNWTTNTIEYLKWEARWRAAMKYIRADAMLSAREKGTK